MLKYLLGSLVVIVVILIIISAYIYTYSYTGSPSSPNNGEDKNVDVGDEKDKVAQIPMPVKLEFDYKLRAGRIDVKVYKNKQELFKQYIYRKDVISKYEKDISEYVSSQDLSAEIKVVLEFDNDGLSGIDEGFRVVNDRLRIKAGDKTKEVEFVGSNKTWDDYFMTASALSDLPQKYK